MGANTNTTTQKIKFYLSITLAVVIATAFFIHMGIPTASDSLKEANVKWGILKSRNSSALDALKQLNFDLHQNKISSEEFLKKQPALVEAYTTINTEKNELYEAIVQLKSEARFLQFDSFQYFLGEIGWALGLLINTSAIVIVDIGRFWKQ